MMIFQSLKCRLGGNFSFFAGLCYVVTDPPEDNSAEEISILVCLNDDQTVQERLLRIVYPSCLMISNVFLLITFGIYACCQELRRPLFGKLTMIFLISLTFAYLMVAIIKFIE